jgi:hypothetical protein
VTSLTLLTLRLKIFELIRLLFLEKLKKRTKFATMDDRELTFDEFRAQKHRATAAPATKAPASVSAQENANKAKVKMKKEGGKSRGVGNRRMGRGMGAFLEMNEMQILYIVVLFLTLAAELLMAQAVLENSEMDYDHDYKESLNVLILSLLNFITFARYFFMVELVALVLIFQLKVLGVYGYLIDASVLIVQMRYGAEPVYGRLLSVLSFLRLWRVYRLYSKSISEERILQSKTVDSLENTRKELIKFKTELSTKDEELDKEKDARKAVEEMLQNYKEEVDTLNEALKIAARDIAEVGEADDIDFADSDDDLDDYQSLASGSQSHTHSHHSYGHKDALYDMARKQPTPKAQPTIVVNPDGTFIKM